MVHSPKHYTLYQCFLACHAFVAVVAGTDSAFAAVVAGTDPAFVAVAAQSAALNRRHLSRQEDGK